MFATNVHFCQILTRHGRIDIHWDICKVTGSRNDGWLIHAVLARCIYGLQTHEVDEATRVRTPYRYTGDNITEFSFPDDRKFARRESRASSLRTTILNHNSHGKILQMVHIIRHHALLKALQLVWALERFAF